MKLENLRVAVLGDSITQGVGVADPKSCYHALLAEKYHWNATVDGISGTRIAPQEKVWDWEEPRMKEDFCGRVKNLPQDADLLIFFGGTNDFGHGDTPFGAWGDHKPSTFCGAVFSMMREMVERLPGAVKVICTPLHRLNEGNPCGDVKPQPVATLEEYVEIIRKTAAYFALPVMDFYALSGLQPRVPIIQQAYVPDGLHPNEEGHKLLAARLEGYLLSL